MANKMLIDASHSEETRVVVLRGKRVEEFDFESSSRKQLRGNIYLAKVIRVEPSLQAAFIEYGGNRHGFLAFSEIHPDYYQIPAADRKALVEEEMEEKKPDLTLEPVNDDSQEFGTTSDPLPSDESPLNLENTESDKTSTLESDSKDSESISELDAVEERIELVGLEDAMEEVPEREQKSRRQYKIQDVIKKRQILLVQVLKEERGTKGVALSTYISLPGRFSVLMPNSPRGGGVSRKIGSVNDRKRLKKIATDFEVPEGMGVIIRTAGATRTNAEIKRDYEYLLRLWEQIRELTLKSTAPCVIYEESSLIKRSIRDLYSKDIGQILVCGEEGHQDASEFMKMIMPSHVKNVKKYSNNTPMFIKYGVESQLESMFSPYVNLKSGGYIVINQTEALVSIDVNSGKATREHNIEDTAVLTNLEASEEIARQLRLRDLAGLIVVDFIDMEDNKNNKTVEKRIKECLSSDRARIQLGRISHFGLFEMSRQRIRTGILESSTEPCIHCSGSGMLRTTESVALFVLRSLEGDLLKNSTHNLTVKTSLDVALYILNQKRSHLADLEKRFGISIEFNAEDTIASQQYLLVKEEPSDTSQSSVKRLSGFLPDSNAINTEITSSDDVEEEGNKKRKRWKRKRRGQIGGTDGSNDQVDATQKDSDDPENKGGLKSNKGSRDSDGRTRHKGFRSGIRRNKKQQSNNSQTSDSIVLDGSTDSGSQFGRTQIESLPPISTSMESDLNEPKSDGDSNSINDSDSSESNQLSQNIEIRTFTDSTSAEDDSSRGNAKKIPINEGMQSNNFEENVVLIDESNLTEKTSRNGENNPKNSTEPEFNHPVEKDAIDLESSNEDVENQPVELDTKSNPAKSGWWNRK